MSAETMGPAPNAGGLVEKAATKFTRCNLGISLAEDFNETYLVLGPYTMARDLGVLVNNSGEEFAIEWMTYWNANHATPSTRY